MSFKAIFLTVAALVIFALVGAGIFLWLQADNIKGLALTLVAPPEVKIGVPFELRAQIGNDSDNILKDAELTLQLPAGIAFVGGPEGKDFDSKQLGTLGEGSVTEEKFTLIALTGKNMISEIKAVVSYMPANLGSRFEKQATVSFAVTESALAFDIALPEKVFAGEDFTMKVSYRNIGDEDMHDLSLTLTYPPAYAFREATLKPSSGNNIWDLGDFRKGSDGKFDIKGALIGTEGSFFEIKAGLAATFGGRSYVIAEKTAAIGIAAAPLSLLVKLGGDPPFVHAGDDLSYRLEYMNNTEVALRDVVVTAKLSGELFDLSTLTTNAAFRQNDRTIVWNGGNTDGLSLIASGGSGAVEFRIKLNPTYPLRRLSDKNFILRVEAQIESPTVPSNVSSNKTIGIARLETKVGGAIAIDARGLFRDAASGILNSGPLPPKVGSKTQFTVHWRVTNYATDVKNVVVKAFLGNNVRATGVFKSNISATPSYNDRTGEIRWEIPLVSAGRGVVNAPVEAIFQVELTPGANQAGIAPVLLQETTAEAFDDFTGETLRSRDDQIKTDTLTDPTVTPGQGTVVP